VGAGRGWLIARILRKDWRRKMEKEQVDEMARAIDEFCQKELGTEFNDDILTNFAKHFYNADYRKQSEVIDEFADRLKEAPIKCGLPLLGLSTKEEIEEYFNGIMLQVRDAIDSIAKKMKGGAE
jgi:hypothetical protein